MEAIWHLNVTGTIRIMNGTFTDVRMRWTEVE